MIVISAALLSTPGDIPLTHARLLYESYGFDLDAQSVVVSTEDEDGPRDAPLRPDTHEAWIPTALPAMWTLDLGQARDVDAVGVLGRIGSLGVQAAISYSTDNDTFTALASAINQGDDAPMLFLDTAKTARYVRLTLSGSSAVMPSVAVMYVGKALAMQRPIYGGHGPGFMQRETELTQAMSRGGEFLGQEIRRMGVVEAFSFRNLTAAWVRSDFDPFIRSARKRPLFVGWRPSTWPREVTFGSVTGDIRPKNSGTRDLMDVDFTIRGWGWT